MTNDRIEPAPLREARREDAKPEVSVIVPVYNVAPYLRRCIDSLLRQTLREIEIFLIDDGSTDGSGLICDEYAARDSRIQVIHQENAGVSEARNTGLDRASADYIMFVDSDDWLEPDFCETPLTRAKRDEADLVIFRYRAFRNGKEEKRRSDDAEGEKTEEEALHLLIDNVGMNAWNKLYHRSLFRERRYPAGQVYEDVVLTPVLVHNARKIVYIPDILYNREHRPGSITRVFSARNGRDRYNAFVLTTGRMKEWGYHREAERLFLLSMMSFVTGRWDCPEIEELGVRHFRELKRCPKYFNLKQRVKFRLLVLSPGLYRRTCRFLRVIRRDD